MGWNEIELKKDCFLFSNIKNKSHVYFIHSYEFMTKKKEHIVATTNYGNSIIASVVKENIVRWNVPGSFELVYGCKTAQQKADAVIAIGSVIQGETKHFVFVCQGVTQGIVQLNLNAAVPVIFCVLTDNTLEQAQARSGGKHGNKGVEAAVAALKMAALNRL